MPATHDDGALVVAVDLSTTAAKAVLVDAVGHVHAEGSAALETASPHPAWHEQDATQWWSAARSAIAGAVAQVDPAKVRALCVTHQRETFVCLDAEDRPLRPAILWVDGRASAEIAELGTGRVHQVSGKPPDTTPAIYKLAWLSRHEPTALSRAARVGDVQAYLARRLTGRWATSVASADTLGLLDLSAGSWSPALLELAGVRVDQLPELVPTGDEIGRLTARAAEELGLASGLPVVAGLGDGQSAGLALRTDQPGVAYLNLGTSMVLGVRADAYAADPAFRTLAGMVPGTFTLETVLNAASYLAAWCRRELGDPGLDADAQLAFFEQAAARVPPGSEGLITLPYWNAAQTPYWDPDARGAVVGWHGRHTRAHLYRSLLEGVAFELRRHLEDLERATGRPVRVIRAVGGGARSETWMRIVTDVTRRPVEVCSAGEMSAAGAGALAHSWLAGRPGTADLAPPTGRTVEPDPPVADVYDRWYVAYRGLYPALRETFSALAGAQTPGRVRMEP
ncbi:FGGY family carbohydrate kinase [Isoptericola sp. b441]|uniref:FGGY family carbohydrate kinase n=1 Tax=Actinotalea lenta TaxID=3064654 RepID=A0ABT9D7A4_9CELL|nr:MULTISPECIES: FGGY family carbohydrate kinase [unclassified Isoptericola]MDO8106729.1 FGGY family carbohydrate kinase [Isoptericola sp. b441]MDO8121559.1 FGGY family carbohydrate kinase [Isoptericola sp. b490]